MRVHYLQHVENEDLANMEPWLVKRGHSITRTLLYRKHSLPSPGSFDWLIIMGGPMNADEHVKYPWLKKEKAFIKESIGMGKVVLGVCLGAQLIARALGAKVRKIHLEVLRRNEQEDQLLTGFLFPGELEQGLPVTGKIAGMEEDGLGIDLFEALDDVDGILEVLEGEPQWLEMVCRGQPCTGHQPPRGSSSFIRYPDF